MRSQCLRDAEARTLAETGECEIRRAVKPQPEYVAGTVWSWHFPKPDRYGVSGITGCEEGLLIGLRDYCPLGQPGERRWSQEKWTPYADEQTKVYCQTHDPEWGEKPKPAVYAADYVKECPPLDVGGCEKWRSPATMPRWASRFIVEILSTEAILRDGVWYWTARVRRVDDA